MQTHNTARVVFSLLIISAFSGCTTNTAYISAIQDNHRSDNGVVTQPLIGQMNQTLQASSRSGVSFRGQFRGQAASGTITLTADRPVSFDLHVNHQVMGAMITLDESQQSTIDISAVTRDGSNFLKLLNVSDNDARITSQIHYPELRAANTDNDYDFSALDQQILSDIGNGFPGAVLAVVKDGQLIKHQAYGYALRYLTSGELSPAPESMQTSTLFDLASNTKMYAANYALMRLSSQGKLDVTQPIVNYIPEYVGDGREARLVKDLLNHTAGYEPSTAFYAREYSEARGLYSQDPDATKELLISKVPFRTARNTKMVYSDNDYLLLGVLIERITGKALDEYVEQEIYKPLGLTSTMYNPLLKGILAQQTAATELAGNSRGGRITFDNIRTSVIRGEVHDEKAFYSMAGIAGHAGLFSTAKEVAKLAMVVLNRGGYGNFQVFSASTMDQYLKPSDMDITTGLGWRRAGNGERAWQFGPYASPYAIGHTGWTGTVTIIDPLHDLIIVLLTNKKHTPIMARDGNYTFLGDEFETGRYGTIVSLVYEAVLD